VDKSMILKARQANLPEYLISIGIPLIRSGRRYVHPEYDSLVFTDNSYYWNSRHEHGNSIDYLINHMQMSFQDAVSALLNVPLFGEMRIEKTKTAFDIGDVSISNNMTRVKRYLHKNRSIGHGMINFLIKDHLLHQEERTNNALFLMYDEGNNCVGVEIQGTVVNKRFKGIKANSKYGYGFNVRFSTDNYFEYALFFESAIDLVSFIDYKMNCENKSLDRCLLVSMSGLKLNVVEHTLSVFDGKLTPVFCVDNDSAGKTFIDELKPIIRRSIILQPDGYKDWNDLLVAIRKTSPPIGRLMQTVSGKVKR